MFGKSIFRVIYTPAVPNHALDGENHFGRVHRQDHLVVTERELLRVSWYGAQLILVNTSLPSKIRYHNNPLSVIYSVGRVNLQCVQCLFQEYFQ